MNKEGAKASMRMIIDDCAKDVADRDGQPLTAENVAKWMGQDNAKIAAIARTIYLMLEDS
jgi:hypothetical protein